MKKTFYLLIFISSSLFSSAQNTWVQKLSYSNGGFLNNDSLTGVKEIEVGTDGSVYILASLNENNNENIFKFDPNSNQLQWSIYAGDHGGLSGRWTNSIKATSDSGIITCYNQYDNMQVFGYIKKYSKDGVLQWSRQFGNYFWITEAYDVLEKSTGGYYALISDSIYEFDVSGTVMDSSGLIDGKKIIGMTNGDLLVLTPANLLIRTDITGNIFWSQPCSGVFAYDGSNVFIANGNSFVRKVDAVTGIQQWNRDFGFSPLSGIEPVHDGGFIASAGYKPYGVAPSNGVAMPGNLFRADSTGDTLWTRTYEVPHFGLSALKLLSNGNIISGGCYLSGCALWIPTWYSTFYCQMDSDGTNPLLQTSYIRAGDANHDHITSFVDDALETMLSIGQTGIPRDSSLDGQGPVMHNHCECWDIATDWSSLTNSGANSRYADFDGNGIIDTNDVSGYGYCMVDSFPVPYRLSSTVHAGVAEDFCLIPVNDIIQLQSADSLFPSDTVYYYMIMGSNVNPVDSIYGFAFSYSISEAGNNWADSIDYFDGVLGQHGIDLFTFQDFRTCGYWNQYCRSHTLICRTDFQNAYNINDTLGIIRFVGLFNTSPFTPSVVDFKAILADGTEIPFNVCTGSVFIDSSLVSIRENEKVGVKIFPNPASRYLNIETGSTSLKKVVLMNSLGEKIKTLETSLKVAEISVEDLSNGFYIGKVESGEQTVNFKFIVQH
jgi:hypothetical protein